MQCVFYSFCSISLHRWCRFRSFPSSSHFSHLYAQHRFCWCMSMRVYESQQKEGCLSGSWSRGNSEKLKEWQYFLFMNSSESSYSKFDPSSQGRVSEVVLHPLLFRDEWTAVKNTWGFQRKTKCVSLERRKMISYDNQLVTWGDWEKKASRGKTTKGSQYSRQQTCHARKAGKWANKTQGDE